MMTKKTKKKRALVSSIISVILCISMLLGTTMAWFTDTASNTGNRILTGDFGVDLLKYYGEKDEYESIADGEGDIFVTDEAKGERLNGILWEPGKTEVVLLQVENTGNLALNYNIVLDVTNETDVALEEALSYAIISNVAGKDVGKANVAKYSDFNITSWADIQALQGAEIGVVPAGTTKAAPNGALLKGESDYFALAVHMDEDAGNEYQNQSILIDVKVEAKQMPYEYDSFSNQYDAKAEYPLDGIVYHVSTTGDDNNPGTQKEPFATIAKASEVVSALDHEGENVYVLIHGGTYMLTESIEFSGAAAGGTEKNKVVYRAAGDGEVVFSGYLQIPTTALSSAVGSEVGNLIPEEAQPYVMKVDLGAYGLESTDFNLVEDKSRDKTIKDNMEYFTLLLNGKEQTLAQWPNYGAYETILLEDIVYEGTNYRGGEGAILKFMYSNMDKWTEKSLSQAVVRGYLSRNYREEWNQIETLDKENQTMELKYHTDSPVSAGRNWKIVNMVEELDRPGEFCIDFQHSDLALYYYPSYNLSETDVLELSVVKDVYLICEDTQNIVFEGIEFTGFRNTDMTKGLITVRNSDNIEIRNCTFTHNDGGANIAITGSNNIVEACGFYNCGSTGVFFYGGGSYETLERQNNVVINNHFYNSGYSNVQDTPGAVTNWVTHSATGETVGNVIKNNLIHHIYGSGSIRITGAEYEVSYNEISNGLRNLEDYGLIYVAGTVPQPQGTMVNYNYLHDYYSLCQSNNAIVQAVYFDDWQSGQTANNNIVVANSNIRNRGLWSVGAYNTFKYNILANTELGIMQGDREKSVSENSGLRSFVETIPTLSDVYKEKYPFLFTLPDLVDANDGYFPLVGNVITDNIAYNAAYSIKEKAVELGTVENNLTVNDTNGVFVDPDNHDWRITSEFAASNNLSENFITEDNFSMDEIGIQKEVWDIKNPLDSFKQLYPKNGTSNIRFDEEIVLNWEQALFADEYQYVVATDPELTEVVASGTTAYEYVNLGKLPAETTYYWKVTAVNTTKQLAAEWASEGEAFVFTVGEEIVDKTKLEETIAEATTVFAAVEDGEVNKVGDFKVGTETKLAALLQEANTIYNQKVSQAQVDAEVVKLRTAIDGIDAYQYKGYVTLDTSTVEKWKNTTNSTTVTEEEEGVITINGKKTVVYTETLPNCNLITFDIKPTLAKGYMAFTFRTVNPDVANVYEGTSYLLWIKASNLADNHIELQKNPYGGTGPEMLIKTPNTDIIRDGEWHNFQIATMSLEGGGVRIIFKVDGEEIFDFVDNSETSQWDPIYGTGTIAFQTNQNKIEIRAAETIPTDIY